MRDVSIEEFDAALSEGATGIDVRESVEFAQAAIAGTRHVPMGRLPEELHTLDPTAPVYVVCATGNRSGAMTDYLRSQGYDARNVLGGVVAWARSGRPIESRHRALR